jgi:hypothetical protein
MYAYWSVCLTLVLSLVLITWMDLREVSRNYLEQRKALWSSATRETIEQSGQEHKNASVEVAEPKSSDDGAPQGG